MSARRSPVLAAPAAAPARQARHGAGTVVVYSVTLTYDRSTFARRCVVGRVWSQSHSP